MALLQDGRSANSIAAVESKTKALRTTNAPRGAGYSFSSTSGVVTAGQPAAACFVALRSNPSGTLYCFIEKIRLQFTTITAFTTSVSAGRRLSLFRGSGATPTGGTTIVPEQKDSTAAVSQIAAANNGLAVISTTGAVGTSNIVWEANPFREMAVTHLGAAGANNEDIYDFAATSPIILSPGQVLGLRTINAFDAGGTFQISIDIDWHESVPWNSTTAD